MGMIINSYALGAPAAGKSFSFDGTTNAWMELNSAVISAAPCTIAGWFKASAVNLAHTVAAVGGSTGRLLLGDPNTTGDTMAAQSVSNGGTSRSGSAASTYSSGVWIHFAAVFASTTSRTCYQDAVAGTTDTVSNIPTGFTKTNIGARYSGGALGQRMSGNLAHVAIWNSALSGSDITSLATVGTLPSSVQSGSLVFYCPLTGASMVDSISGLTLSAGSGVASSSDGPF